MFWLTGEENPPQRGCVTSWGDSAAENLLKIKSLPFITKNVSDNLWHPAKCFLEPYYLHDKSSLGFFSSCFPRGTRHLLFLSELWKSSTHLNPLSLLTILVAKGISFTIQRFWSGFWLCVSFGNWQIRHGKSRFADSQGSSLQFLTSRCSHHQRIANTLKSTVKGNMTDTYFCTDGF